MCRQCCPRILPTTPLWWLQPPLQVQNNAECNSSYHLFIPKSSQFFHTSMYLFRKIFHILMHLPPALNCYPLQINASMRSFHLCNILELTYFRHCKTTLFSSLQNNTVFFTKAQAFTKLTHPVLPRSYWNVVSFPVAHYFMKYRNIIKVNYRQ